MMLTFDKCVLILHFDPLLWPQIMRIVGLPTFLLTQRATNSQAGKYMARERLYDYLFMVYTPSRQV